MFLYHMLKNKEKFHWVKIKKASSLFSYCRFLILKNYCLVDNKHLTQILKMMEVIPWQRHNNYSYHQFLKRINRWRKHRVISLWPGMQCQQLAKILINKLKCKPICINKWDKVMVMLNLYLTIIILKFLCKRVYGDQASQLTTEQQLKKKLVQGKWCNHKNALKRRKVAWVSNIMLVYLDWLDHNLWVLLNSKGINWIVEECHRYQWGHLKMIFRLLRLYDEQKTLYEIYIIKIKYLNT